jgi:hypothetical protein
MTPNPRFLGFVWAGFWVMSAIASRILSLTLFPPRRGLAVVEGNWTGLVSFPANFDAVGVRLFDIESRLAPAAALSLRAEQLQRTLTYGHDWRLSLLIVLGLTALALAVVFLRIGRPGEAGTR